ncbi:UNVERIFIED_CONTAM: acyltransferase family protein [Halobacillus marinus]
MKDLRAPEKRFRPEIEGVRAVAALLVAIYHIWLGSVSGGVDVFFIVSGYLITTSLLSRMVREGSLNVKEYVLGLARRLFPVAFTVLFTVIVLSFIVMPQAQWKQIIAEGFSSAFYFQNWQLAFSSVDYLAQNNLASPFQHFWALSLQGQFYITWPFVIMLAYYLARKVLKTPVRKTLLGVLLVLFTCSIAYSIYKTAVNQPWAYFDTFARAWEFSLGGILSLLLPYLKFKRGISIAMGWVGLAIVVFTGMVVPVSTMFPGYIALLPTMGVIFVIVSAENGGRFGVDKLLGSKPFLKFGGISYGFYLWHFPLLILYYSYFNTDTISTGAGIIVLAITVVLAYVSVNYIEKPIRKLNVRTAKRRIVLALSFFIIPTLALNTAWDLYSSQVKGSAYVVEDYPGARAVMGDIEPADDKGPYPTPIEVQENLPSFYEDDSCFTYTNEEGLEYCSKGETENPDYTVALVGGSHSGHWFPALEELSKDFNLQIDVYNKDACRFSADDFNGKLNETCVEWNEDLLAKLLEEPPDLVVTTATVGAGDKVPDGYKEQWRKLEGITEVFAIRDNPRMEEDPLICLEQNDSVDDCSVPRREALADVVPWENTEDLPGNVTYADLSDYFCEEDSCKPVIGNVYVYRDEHHIGTLYSKTLAVGLREPLEEALTKVDENKAS